MKPRNVLGRILSVVLLLLATGSGLARAGRPTVPSAASAASASSAADAPWFTAEVDTEGDTGHYASVAYDPFLGATYVSYYDATSQSLRMARDDRWFSNCGPDEVWFCITLDHTSADVGRHSSIAVRPNGSGMGIAYHDATNGTLKYLGFDNPRLWVYRVVTIDRGVQPVSTTGLYTSLKYNDSGTPFIAYHFNNPSGVDALVLAYYSVASGNCVNGDLPEEWRCETIITGEGVGQYASLAVVDDWEFHIAYYDA
ncbi:MAG: hypothetical protein PVF54_06530, partial [Anaerolineae bacterium]